MLNFFQIKYFDVDTHGAFDSGNFISECQGRDKTQFLLPVNREKKMKKLVPPNRGEM